MSTSTHGAIRDALVEDATVAALVGTRVYPIRLPELPTLPALTYQRISSRPIGSHQGAGELEAGRWQVTAWADTYNGVQALALATERALDGRLGSGIQAAIPAGQLDLFDPETGRYYVPVDVMIWAVAAT